MSVTYNELYTGDPAPWFYQRSFANERYAFDTVGGRYVVLCLFGSAKEERSAKALAFAKEMQRLFDDQKACFFGVSVDPSDESKKRVADSYPGYRYFWDFDGLVSRLYGAAPRESLSGESLNPYRPRWVILSPTLRVRAVYPFEKDGGDIQKVKAHLANLPEVARATGFEMQAPVIYLPHVFEPEFCDHLIGLYEKDGGTESGFMRDVNGKTVSIKDAAHKKRKDYTIEDPKLIATIQDKFLRRITPEILKIHQFKATRMERYIVGCYEAADEGHFRAHRDNTTKGTAHRRFAVSINLNSEFEGGELSFPEYGARSYKPAKGGAVVFSCSLLHAVSKVTSGKRYAFLPFLYDDAAAKIREENHAFLAERESVYTADQNKMAE